jgi:hypothetical protein
VDAEEVGLSVLRFPRFLGGASRPEKEPAPGWDTELQAMQGIGEWLATIPSDEGKYRALAYFMWRLKSGDTPNITQWVDSIAEQSAVKLAQEHGFKEGVE